MGKSLLGTWFPRSEGTAAQPCRLQAVAQDRRNSLPHNGWEAKTKKKRRPTQHSYIRANSNNLSFSTHTLPLAGSAVLQTVLSAWFQRHREKIQCAYLIWEGYIPRPPGDARTTSVPNIVLLCFSIHTYIIHHIWSLIYKLGTLKDQQW